MVLEHHVWSSSFNLTFDNSFPKLLSLDGLVTSALSFILSVELFKFLSMNQMHTWSFVWAEESPISVLLDTLHEQITDPESIEEVSCSILFLSMVLLELKKLKDISVPWFKIHGKGALSLATTLVYISRSFIEHLEHWNQAIRITVRTFDVSSVSSDVVESQPNATSRF
jgi:hypothetical protein